MMERKLYGPMGFNMMYPFSIGDLRDSAVCLTNYMENSGGGKIPWQDLKYIFGEIMCVNVCSWAVLVDVWASYHRWVSRCWYVNTFPGGDSMPFTPGITVMLSQVHPEKGRLTLYFNRTCE